MNNYVRSCLPVKFFWKKKKNFSTPRHIYFPQKTHILYVHIIVKIWVFLGKIYMSGCRKKIKTHFFFIKLYQTTAMDLNMHLEHVSCENIQNRWSQRTFSKKFHFWLKFKVFWTKNHPRDVLTQNAGKKNFFWPPISFPKVIIFT